VRSTYPEIHNYRVGSSTAEQRSPAYGSRERCVAFADADADAYARTLRDALQNLVASELFRPEGARRWRRFFPPDSSLEQSEHSLRDASPAQNPFQNWAALQTGTISPVIR
jgi:hypothetical protein